MKPKPFALLYVFTTPLYLRAAAAAFAAAFAAAAAAAAPP
eukprot:COSAG01_NODE_33500_length_563_cov_0.821121_1_plen_39_part_01